jgi:hypothetical protein
MFKPIFAAGLALALTACAHSAPTTQVVAPAPLAAEAAKEKANRAKAQELITKALIQPGQEVRMSVINFKIVRSEPGVFTFTCTRTENTRYQERKLYLVKGIVDVNTGKVTSTERYTGWEPMLPEN